MPAEHSFHFLTERTLAKRDTLVHPSIQPYIPFFSTKYRNAQDSHRVFKYIKGDPAIELIFNRHFVQVGPTDEDFTLTIDPLLNLESGRDFADSVSRRLYTNTRGIAASGTIGKKFYFETMIAENQSILPAYLSQAAETSSIIPGQGRWKRFKTAGYDYAFAAGIISIQPVKNLNVQLGHGKHKIGHGYRSLLLSDNSFNYPFARITQQWFSGRIRYSNIYAVLMNLRGAAARTTPFTERLFQKKLASFQLAEIQVIPALNVSLFQGVVWAGGDSRNRLPGGWEYVNPFIYSHLAANGLDGINQNVVAGANVLLKITNSIGLYAQAMADHSDDGTGFQAGLKISDALRVKGLSFQAEHNNTGKNAFVRAKGSMYTHYNQQLSVTPGNGTENVLITDFRRNRFFMNVRYHLQAGADSARTRNNLVNIRLGYLINPRYNLNVSAGYTGRRNFDTFSGVNSRADYLFIALRTSLYNVYYDF